VPSDVAGTVKEIKVKTGDKVSQGTVIALVEAADAGKPTPRNRRRYTRIGSHSS
jgi:dihydrolipoamide dehydrogenase